VVPLAPPAYTPGGAVPSAQAAREALGPDYPPQFGWFDGLDHAFRANNHAYLLLVAPTAPGTVTVTLSCGAGQAPTSSKATRTLTIDIKP
jgi:hypothetical protein